MYVQIGFVNAKAEDLCSPRRPARLVGGVLVAADAGSQHLADAHVIAAAVDVGGGLALTTDAEDLERLVAAYRDVMVVPLP